MESKNWSLVRAYVGWRRYDTEEELKILDRLLRLITIRHNLFMPHMKLLCRERLNGRVKRQYEMDIPLNRLLKVTEDRDKIERLKRMRGSIDIVRLSNEIEGLSERLSLAYEKKLRRVNYVNS